MYTLIIYSELFLFQDIEWHHWRLERYLYVVNEKCQHFYVVFSGCLIPLKDNNTEGKYVRTWTTPITNFSNISSSCSMLFLRINDHFTNVRVYLNATYSHSQGTLLLVRECSLGVTKLGLNWLSLVCMKRLYWRRPIVSMGLQLIVVISNWLKRGPSRR